MDTNESLEAHVAITVLKFRISIVVVHLTPYSEMIKEGFLPCTKLWCEPHASNFCLGFLYGMYILGSMTKSGHSRSKPSTLHTFLPLCDSYQGWGVDILLSQCTNLLYVP